MHWIGLVCAERVTAESPGLVIGKMIPGADAVQRLLYWYGEPFGLLQEHPTQEDRWLGFYYLDGRDDPVGKWEPQSLHTQAALTLAGWARDSRVDLLAARRERDT